MKRNAVLTPNSSIPLTASRAPINYQCRCSVSPAAPPVLIESTEKRKASNGESRAPSHKYAAAQIAHSIPCTTDRVECQGQCDEQHSNANLVGPACPLSALLRKCLRVAIVEHRADGAEKQMFVTKWHSFIDWTY